MGKMQWLLSQIPILKNPRTAKKVSGDAIFNNNYIFSFIVGTLLGDSHMERRGPSSRLKIRQSAIHAEYLLFIWKMLSDAGLCSGVQPQITPYLNKTTGRTYYHLKFNTYSFEQFNWFHNYFYIPVSSVAMTDSNYFKVNSTRSLYIKVIPLDIKKYLSPVALAYWVMDDGAIISSTLKLCTHWFSWAENIVLRDALIELYGIHTTIFIDSKSLKDKLPLYALYVLAQSYPKLRDVTLPYIHSSMLYKIIREK